MTPSLVLDSGALVAVADERSRHETTVRAAVRAAKRLNREVIVPAVVLAELYRGPKHNQMVDSCLSRETGILVRDTDRALARLVGGVLSAAKAGAEDLADAHVVACAVETGGGVVVTGDPDDLGRLSATYPNVVVKEI
jgi:predicted nucleic acid-binding protein